MRILQVVSLLSPDGAFGGPARVALNQSSALLDAGHDVVLAAGARGYPMPPVEADGVPLRLFPVQQLLPFVGFPGMAAPGLAGWVRAHWRDFDVMHIHLGRDLMVLPVAVLARRAGIPYVLQTHGMAIPSRHPLAAPLDAVWTRDVLRHAAAVCYLTDTERAQLVEVARGDLPLVHLLNGVPDYPAAPDSEGPAEVLYLARLHSRKRPVLFVEMAHRLLADGVDARFSLVGPDEGEAPAVLAAIGDESRIRWEGPIDPAAAPQRMAQATAYVLPAEREPYPMAVLEAMSVGLPVVVCGDCGLAPMVAETGGGAVSEGTADSLAAAVTTVLADPAGYGGRAQSAARRDFGMGAVADRLVSIYRTAVPG